MVSASALHNSVCVVLGSSFSETRPMLLLATFEKREQTREAMANVVGGIDRNTSTNASSSKMFIVSTLVGGVFQVLVPFCLQAPAAAVRRGGLLFFAEGWRGLHDELHFLEF